MLELCSQTKKNGQPCTARTIKASEFCIAHHPNSGEWRSKGGKNKSNVARAEAKLPEGLRPIAQGLMEGFIEAHAGNLEPRVLTSMAASATALIKVAEFALLEERLMALEERFNERLNPKA